MKGRSSLKSTVNCSVGKKVFSVSRSGGSFVLLKVGQQKVFSETQQNGIYGEWELFVLDVPWTLTSSGRILATEESEHAVMDAALSKLKGRVILAATLHGKSLSLVFGGGFSFQIGNLHTTQPSICSKVTNWSIFRNVQGLAPISVSV